MLRHCICDNAWLAFSSNTVTIDIAYLLAAGAGFWDKTAIYCNGRILEVVGQHRTAFLEQVQNTLTLNPYCHCFLYHQKPFPSRWYYMSIMSVSWWPTRTHLSYLTVESREAPTPPDLGFNFSNRSEVWQASRLQCCPDACRIAERCNHHNIQSHGLLLLRGHF